MRGAAANRGLPGLHKIEVGMMNGQPKQIRGLRIKIVDPDDDYLGVDIQAANSRCAGSARIYAGLQQLTEFANQIRGFPASVQDERAYEFGSRDRSIAGGYCKLHLRCVDHIGHPVVEIMIEDDERLYLSGHAGLTIEVEAAGIDRFVEMLFEIEREKSGEALLPATGAN